MRIFSIVVLLILIVLAVSSGISKLMLLERDVEFFGRYGFNIPMLIAFGLVQLFGGLLMIFRKTRFAAAAVVAITFLGSLVALLMDGDIPTSIVTVIATLLLGFTMQQSRIAAKTGA